MSSYRQDPAENGLDRIRLQNRHLELAVVPAAGGKILDLIDRRNARNWLWRNPHVPLSRASRGADFDTEQDSGGWDEVLLSITPGEIRSGDSSPWRIPDHGDLIGRAWSIDDLHVTAEGDAICDLKVLGDTIPYRFWRRIRLVHGKPEFRLSYRLTNDGDDPLPWYWCAHPLLAVEPDTRIELEGGLRIRVDDARTRAQVDANGDQHWPELSLKDGSPRDLSRSFAHNGAERPLASKIYVRSPENGAASAVLGASGARLTLEFNAEELPWIGVWINNRGWSGCGSDPYFNLGIEPATSPYDCVNEAIRHDAVPWIEAGGERHWSLRVVLQA